MNILIDIGHPAHVHYFKNPAKIWLANGHSVLFTARDKDVALAILDQGGFDYVNLGKPFKGWTGKLKGLGVFNAKILSISRRYKPDMFVSHGSMYAAQVAWLLRKPHISLEDTFNLEQIRIYLPFTKVVLTGDYEHPSLGKKEIRYKGYQELAYLHPMRFSPDVSVFEELGIEKDLKYVIVRFVAWRATHDAGHKGISFRNKIKMINELEKCSRVFISSEIELSDEFSPYRINIAPHRIHDALFYARLLIGESATMASECAMLGTPSIFLDSTGRYYTRDLENLYGLVFNFNESEDDQRRAIEKGIELLEKPDVKNEWQQRRKRMLREKIDVSAFLAWFIESYPSSLEEMKADPGCQDRFLWDSKSAPAETTHA